MKIIVLSRYEAEHYTQPAPWAHIAITDPAPGARPPRNRCRHKVDALHVWFADVTPRDFQNNPAFRRFEPGLFDAGHAGRIIAFLEKHKNLEVDVMVNCGAGISRSSAVANFILDYFHLAQAPFAPPRYQPNPYVLDVLRAVAARRRSDQPAPAIDRSECGAISSREKLNN